MEKMNIINIKNCMRYLYFNKSQDILMKIKSFFILFVIQIFILSSCIKNIDNTMDQSKNTQVVKNEYNNKIEVGCLVNFGKYEWQVLEIYDDDIIFIITKNIIKAGSFVNEFIGDNINATWEISDLRNYLNNIFLYEFTDDEIKCILPKNIHTPSNEWYSIRGGDDTVDYIFLLSIGEVIKYFGDSGILDDFAQPQDGIRQWLLSDQYNSERIATTTENINSSWWLRFPGFDVDFIAIVLEDGSIRIDGHMAKYENGGIRPALLLNIN